MCLILDLLNLLISSHLLFSPFISSYLLLSPLISCGAGQT